MADMKSEAKSDSVSTTLAEAPSPYPYGLTIHLGEDEIEKLEIKELPRVGDQYSIKGLVFVKGVFSSETVDGKLQRSLDLQITDLELEAPKKKKDAAKTIYGSGEPANTVKLPAGSKVVSTGYF